MTATTHRSRPDGGSVSGRTPRMVAASPSQPGTPAGGAPTPSPTHARPSRAIASLYARLIRRGTLLLAVAMAGYSVLEIASYRSAYPDGISPAQFAMFEDNPAVRMMSGAPYALDNAAGFALWDAGWIWQLILAVWAILITTRFLRGEEDLDRADLVLAGPVRAARVTGIVLGVVAAAGALIGAVVTMAMIVMGQALTSSVLLGLALAAVTALFASVAAVTCQLVDVRRRAAGVAAAVLGVA
jgi:ABC-2 type transport system permease protein